MRRKIKKELLQEQKKCFKQVVFILFCVIIIFSLLCCIVLTQVKKSELTHSVNSLKNDIYIAESENLYLQSQVESMCSIAEIDRYAVEKLGMTKVKAHRFEYINSAAFKEQKNKIDN